MVTSPASHAEDVLGGALVMVPVGDLDAYVAALKRLREDPDFYAERCAATKVGTEVFFDRACGYGDALGQALRICFPGRI